MTRECVGVAIVFHGHRTKLANFEQIEEALLPKKREMWECKQLLPVWHSAESGNKVLKLDKLLEVPLTHSARNS